MTLKRKQKTKNQQPHKQKKHTGNQRMHFLAMGKNRGLAKINTDTYIQCLDVVVKIMGVFSPRASERGSSQNANGEG